MVSWEDRRARASASNVIHPAEASMKTGRKVNGSAERRTCVSAHKELLSHWD